MEGLHELNDNRNIKNIEKNSDETCFQLAQDLLIFPSKIRTLMRVFDFKMISVSVYLSICYMKNS